VKNHRFFGLVLGLVWLESLTGCNSLPPEGQKIFLLVSTFIETEWNNLFGEPEPTPSPVESPTPNGTGLLSQAAKTSKENSELLKEIYEVVYLHEPKDPAEFGNWLDTMNQGASLEGVYNGFTHSPEYRLLEDPKQGASVEALGAFGQELAYLEVELTPPTQFDNHWNAISKGLELAPSPVPVESPEVISLETIQQLSADYKKIFVGAPVFTLKRVLGDEALKVISFKSNYRENLALWYSKWVVRLAGRNVDFGVALRNKPDEAFHYKWALESSPDRIRWEVLNRLHRLLNDANREKQ
jgi:hypothetical protein